MRIDFIRNNKGITVIEISIVLIIIGILALGISIVGKEQVDLSYEREAFILIQEIALKERLFSTQNHNRYVNIVSTPSAELGHGIKIDARRNQYFRQFEASYTTESIKDALGTYRDLPLLTIAVTGSGPASGITKTATYNKFIDELIINQN